VRRPVKIALAVAAAALIAIAAGGLLRGPTGASTEFGGQLAATVLPEFTSMSPERWANGAPLSLAEQRGSVILIEAWHPT
jgi:hypothetical protein